MPIKNGDTVSVHYIGTFSDGTEFDRSQPGSPLAFTVGSGTVIAGFDEAVRGHEVGDTFSVTIPAAQAYGESRDDLIFPIAKVHLGNLEPQVGMVLNLRNGMQEFEATIIEIGETEVTLDANHPMAGKDLTFALEIVKIN